MGVTKEALATLGAPTPPEEIKQRKAPGGGNKMLDYIDARFVMDRFDEAVGPALWRDEYRADPQHTDGVVGRIGVLCEMADGSEEWVWKEDVGTDSNIEGTKGSYSDAFKRTAVKWGVGRDLYSPDRVRATGSSTQQRASTGKPVNFPVSNDEAPWVCPEHEAVVAWPAGETKAGRKYDAFYACPEGRKCEHRAPKGLKVEASHLGGQRSEMDSLPF